MKTIRLKKDNLITQLNYSKMKDKFIKIKLMINKRLYKQEKKKLLNFKGKFSKTKTRFAKNKSKFFHHREIKLSEKS